MKHTATCPACHKEINMVHILIAITPFTFKCSHCRARIFVKGITKQIIAVTLGLGLAAVFLLQYLFHLGKLNDYRYLLGPVIILIAMQVTTALLACNKARLVVKKNKS
jgi:uncharacterized PurR-regulated membrane protein YhhQ (DUF165 family)